MASAGVLAAVKQPGHPGSTTLGGRKTAVMWTLENGCVVMLLVVAVGCTTARRTPVNTGSTPIRDVKRDDIVHVVLESGERARVWVSEVTAD
jgi:hypothetical protein